MTLHNVKIDNHSKNNEFTYNHNRNKDFVTDITKIDNPYKIENRKNMRLLYDYDSRTKKSIEKHIYPEKLIIDEVIEALSEINDKENLNLFLNRYMKHKSDLGVEVEDKELKREIDPSIQKRQEVIKNYYNSEQYIELEANFEILEKMIIGLGETHVNETNIKLDHITGDPFIPASTMKGAFRQFCLENNMEASKMDWLFGKSDSDDKEAEKGNLIFMDLYPVGSYIIDRDVMTVHYSDYYKENPKGAKAPTDDQKIIPIFFYVVKEAEFNCISYIPESQEIIEVDKLKEIWGNFLKNVSLGAKKNVGYGQLMGVTDSGE